jgi:hypothetical protein
MLKEDKTMKDKALAVFENYKIRLNYDEGN